MGGGQGSCCSSSGCEPNWALLVFVFSFFSFIFPFFFAFFIYAGSCKNFQFYEFTFWPARRRKRRVAGESRVAVLLADPAADLLPALQLQPNCQLDSPNFSLEFALFAVPHKSVQYFLYEPWLLPLFISLSPLFLTFFQLHLLCRYLS